MAENWKEVPWATNYEVSDLGRVRSKTREIVTVTGVKRTMRGRVLKPAINSTGRLTVNIYNESGPHRTPVHRLVCEAFHGPAPEGKPWVLHNDGNHLNNVPDNLRWGTPKDNAQDTIRHGNNHELRKTHCIRGHEKTPENTYTRPDGTGSGMCRKCIKIRGDRARDSPPPEGSELHGRPSTYTGRGCRCDECVTAMREYKSAFAGVELPEGDYRHGLTGAFTYKCKCDTCLEAARAHYKRTREKRKMEKKGEGE